MVYPETKRDYFMGWQIRETLNSFQILSLYLCFSVEELVLKICHYYLLYFSFMQKIKRGTTQIDQGIEIQHTQFLETCCLKSFW